tara:strand:+ start:401 stop:721 length:321 start_codon:yes stop_codon:yes gene_type:complete
MNYIEKIGIGFVFGIIIILLIMGFELAFLKPEKDMINPYKVELNTIVDLIDWINEDMVSSNIDYESGRMYILHLENIYDRLEKVSPVTHKQYQESIYDKYSVYSMQ